MPILKLQDLEEERHEKIAASMVAGAPIIPTFSPVRNFTPLVVAALQMAQNPYVIGKAGFESIGIKFNAKGKQVTDPTAFAIAMMPKTAEAVVALTCDREQLKAYAVNPAALQSAALDLMEESTMEALAGATVYIAEQLGAISASRANPAPKERKPQSGGGSGAKKHVRTG
jgi:hypothetical protein